MTTVAGYAGRINREQGGSILTIGSGASVNFNSGAVFASSATLAVTSASLQVGDAGSMIVKPAATTLNNPVVIMQIGRNQMWYMASSAACPTFSASPGDIVWIANSASTGIFANLSDGTTGSRWSFFRQTTGSQTLGAK